MSEPSFTVECSLFIGHFVMDSSIIEALMISNENKLYKGSKKSLACSLENSTLDFVILSSSFC